MTEAIELHSPLGPSASERWLKCPGSVLLTKDLPDTSSEFAIEGSAAHLVSEWCRINNLPANKYLGAEVAVEVGDGSTRNVLCDQEMVDGVQAFLDYVDQFHGEAFFELRVNYDAWVPTGFGTADDIRIMDGVCNVTDLKYGKGVKVYAKENSQLMLYALGVFQELGHLWDIDKFQLNICQPRLDHIDEFTISCKDLLTWAQTVVEPMAAATLEPGADLAAGEHCRFCGVRYTCRTRQKWIFDNTVGEMAELEEDEVRDVELLTNEELAEVMKYVEVARSFLTDVEERVMSELQKGHPVGDWKLVEGRSNRAWKDQEAAEKAFRANKVKVNDMFVKKFWTPAQAEKKIGKGNPILVPLVEKPPGKPKLAPGSDPRPELKVSADEMSAM